MNKVIILGRLTKDPELRVTQNNVPVTSFTVAVNRRFDKDNADFISCIAWRKTAEFVAKYFKKGDMISLAGSLQTGKYEKDGQVHYTTDVNVEEVYFTGSKTETTDIEKHNDIDADMSGFMPMPNDDDLPF